MTITIDLWVLIPAILIFVAVGIGLYERGQRKGLEVAEKLYAPVLNAVESNVREAFKG